MDLVAIVVWVLLGTFAYYMLRPTLENFQLSASDVWMDRLTGEFELLYLTWSQLRIGGTPIASMTPFTCPKDKPELDTGLCYVKCKEGYHGVGPVCWADTMSRGAGTAIGLEDCPAGWDNAGLTCSHYNPIHCWGDPWKPVWDSGHQQCGGGDVQTVGRLDHGGKCPGPGGSEYTDKYQGMCYKPCPADKREAVPGMPYLCYKGGDLSYGRGAGVIPHILQFLGGGSYETNVL